MLWLWMALVWLSLLLKAVVAVFVASRLWKAKGNVQAKCKSNFFMMIARQIRLFSYSSHPLFNYLSHSVYTEFNSITASISISKGSKGTSRSSSSSSSGIGNH